MTGLLIWVVLMAAMATILGSAVYLGMRNLKLQGENRWSIGLLLTDVWVIGYTVGVLLVSFLYGAVYGAVECVVNPVPGDVTCLRYVFPVVISLAMVTLYFPLKVAVRFYFYISKSSANAQLDKNNISLFLGIGILGLAVRMFVFGQGLPIDIGILAIIYFVVQIYGLRVYLSSQDIGGQLLAYGFALPLVTVGLYDLICGGNLSVAIVSVLLGLSILSVCWKRK